MAKFIVILGIDKSGKHTLFKGLKKHLPFLKFVSHDREDVPSDMEFLADLRDHFPLTVFNEFSEELRSFIYGTMVEAKNFIVKRYLEQGYNVICDSHYYKHLAKEIVFKRGNKRIHNLWRKKLLRPDLVIFLKIKPEIAFRRAKGEFNNQEYFVRPDKEGFVNFQKKLEKEMLKETRGLNLIFVDAEKNKNQVLKEVETIIKGFLRITKFTWSPEKLARLEVGWWEAHNKRKTFAFWKKVTEKHHLLYGLSFPRAKKAAKYYVDAIYLHSDRDWKSAYKAFLKYHSYLQEHTGWLYDPEKTAKYEIKWLKVHDRLEETNNPNKSKLVVALSDLYKEIFALSLKEARKAAKDFVLALNDHDVAEKPGASKQIETKYYHLAELHLRDHFSAIRKGVIFQKN